MTAMSIDFLILRLRALLPGNRFDPHQVGATYAQGARVATDLRAAARWYRLGARRGDPESQYDLGFMYLLGEGVAADPTRGLAYLKHAANAGHSGAARLLSHIYRDAMFGTARNELESSRWRERALELGWPVEIL
jgi:uncharacterized protein